MNPTTITASSIERGGGDSAAAGKHSFDTATGCDEWSRRDWIGEFGAESTRPMSFRTDSPTQLRNSPNHLAERKIPLFLWLRLGRRRTARQNPSPCPTLDAEVRDAAREVSLYRGPMPAASIAALAAHLLGPRDLADAGGRSC